jgi:hypothetical protein
LCAPTFSAPAIRWSIEMGSSTPSLAATASVSAMIARIARETSGCRTSSSSVPPVSALIGLKATFPSSFTQISWRKRGVTGHRNPAAINGATIARSRSDLVPSGSPKLILLPSVWRMTPGSITSVAK